MRVNKNRKVCRDESGGQPNQTAPGFSANLEQGMTDAVAELSSVNSVLREELAEKELPPAVKNAIDKNERVEDKVQEVSAKLSVVNRALKGEVRDRVMVEHQIAAITEQEEAARHAALHDPLTGLPNRLLFHDRLEHGLSQAQRHGWNLAVMFVDLDDFKEINDTHGHDVGDRVLQTIAERLIKIGRADDTISRHGGDEFIYLLMETRDVQDTKLIAKKIIKAIQLPCELNVGENTINPCVNASIGISMYPKDGTTADALVKSADAAMYPAKQGKFAFAFAS